MGSHPIGAMNHMPTKEFKTRSIIKERYFPCPDPVWVSAIDIGYSGIKGISPNKYYCIPAYAKKLREEPVMLKAPSPTDILYRNGDELWSVGELAYQEADSSRMPDNESVSFGRLNRYYSPAFQVQAETGIGISLLNNGYSSPDGKKLVIQTGLPPQYIEDTPVLKEVLSGTHSFELKVGDNPWQDIQYTLEEGQIYVMSQPLGAFASVCYDSSGKPLPVSWKLYNSNVLVFDPGFGTLDLYLIKKGHVSPEFLMTLPNQAMKEVFVRTCRDIHEEFGVSLQIAELQNRLEDGTIRVTNRRQRSRKSVPFEGTLMKNCQDVCMEALDTMFDSYEDLAYIDFIIGTGGTYDAWKGTVSKELGNLDGIKLLPGNCNDTSLSNVFSNVRGYYFQRVYQSGRDKA